MLGINGVVATGLHRRYGWQLAAIAGVAAIAPDWDGLTFLVSVPLFNESHRVWGHNVFACVFVGLVCGAIDFRYDMVTRCGRMLMRLLRVSVAPDLFHFRTTYPLRGFFVWIIVAIVAALSQIPADMVVSGTKVLADWPVKCFWPISDRGYVFPLVPWRDVGITIVFSVGMFAMVKWRNRTSMIAIATLIAVLLYIAVRGLVSSRLDVATLC